MLCKMQSAFSRIWTRVAVSISYDDNHYTTYLLTENADECWTILSIREWNLIISSNKYEKTIFF